VNFDGLATWLRRRTFREAVWLFPLGFLLHVLEEAPQFTAWVRRYASPQFAPRDFLRNNGLGLVLGIVLTAVVSRWPNRGMVALYFAAILTQDCVFNALFHVATTALYGAYSPGLITSLVVRPPLYVYLSRLAWRERLLAAPAAIVSFAAAALIHAMVVAQQVYLVRLF
jgi:uncharacterized protein with HXXEE motif